MTVKVAINGVSGRMGKALVEAGSSDAQITLSAALVREGSPLLGMDSGEWSGVGHNGVPIGSMVELDASSFDVWIDFTLPAGVMTALSYCVERQKPMVIGTTGLDAAQKQQIDRAAQSIPIVWAPNMSVGVNVCLQLLQQAAKLLGDGYDIEIIEAHHRHKKDAPSGTALRMGEVVAQTLHRDLGECAVYGREGHCPRNENAIGFETVRAGDIVGEHTVMFAGIGERVEISHKASSRLTFANGALRAAAWLNRKKCGLYDMRDVLGLA